MSQSDFGNAYEYENSQPDTVAVEMYQSDNAIILHPVINASQSIHLVRDIPYMSQFKRLSRMRRDLINAMIKTIPLSIHALLRSLMQIFLFLSDSYVTTSHSPERHCSVGDDRTQLVGIP